MHFFSAILLASVAVSQTLAVSIRHAHLHRSAAPSVDSIIKRDGLLSSADASRLSSLGFSSNGANSETDNGSVWVGEDGEYTNAFTNDSGEDLILVVWGSAGSWVNANAPLITVSVSAGDSTTISFASGQSGAWAAVNSDTALTSDGQVDNTWGEYTFGDDGVFDVSREVNMNGHSMSVAGSDCTSNMEECVFVCTDSSASTCGTSGSYTLQNCNSTGSSNGEYDGNASGGCQVSNSLTTSLS